MGLKIEWIDPRGTIWDLTSGDRGVILDMEQAGMGWPELDHTFTRGEMTRAHSRVMRASHAFKVLVGHNLTEMDWYRLNDEWWYKANSPFATGTLRVTRPDGMVRERRLHLKTAPDTTYSFDPGLGLDPQPELWELTGNGAYWLGAEQVKRWTPADLTGGSNTPFYGNPPNQWPLYIGGAFSTKGATVDNNGQGPMWLEWTLVGPMTNPRLGIDGAGELVYQGTLLAGEQVKITTDPATRAVVETGSGISQYGAVSGTWASVPVGSRVPLTISADTMGTGASIYLSAREQFAGAF